LLLSRHFMTSKAAHPHRKGQLTSLEQEQPHSPIPTSSLSVSRCGCKRAYLRTIAPPPALFAPLPSPAATLPPSTPSAYACCRISSLSIAAISLSSILPLRNLSRDATHHVGIFKGSRAFVLTSVTLSNCRRAGRRRPSACLDSIVILRGSSPFCERATGSSRVRSTYGHHSAATPSTLVTYGFDVIYFLVTVGLCRNHLRMPAVPATPATCDSYPG